MSHCKKLTKKNKEQLSDMMDVERSKGLKALSRERRERLEAYQHLFYLLQVRTEAVVSPEYLCKRLQPFSTDSNVNKMLLVLWIQCFSKGLSMLILG